jgi:tetratricopeptide (TPR) repeat protein
MIDEERRLAEHLQKAGELLKGGQLDGAEKEIDAALAVRRDDVRARNLRGLWLFRGARYEEAEKIYVELCGKWPDDAALRLNLGLVELRMGKFVEASGSLKKVIAVEPDNGRAQGYLGLALMRTGNLKEAHEAFLKAGQTELARQVEAQLHKQADGAQATGELREAAATGERALQKLDQPFAAVELDAPMDEAGRHGDWQVREPGQPLAGTGGATPLRLLAAEPVPAFATRRLLREPSSTEPFLLAEPGMLVMRVDGRLPTRTFGTLASTDGVTFEPLHRRIRAQATDEPFGDGAEAMLVAVGKGRIIVSARGARFMLLALADDIVYVREGTLFAFEESLAWESGRIPGGGSEGARVVQFRGHGRLVLRTERPVYTLKTEEAPLFVEQAALLGWIGRVVPRQVHGDAGPAAYIECSGEGVLILEEPPTISV